MNSYELYYNRKTAGFCWEEQTFHRLNNEKCLEKYGYKVYSQNDEDGIIQEIFNRIGTTNKMFIEFGVQDGVESNCHYLLFKDWKGLWIEADDKKFEEIKKKFCTVIKLGQLKIKKAFINRDNINSIFKEMGFLGEIDLLSIDIDGNDYHIWNNINSINPRVVIIEYNAKFPPDLEWIMPYYEKHVWDSSDKHGASLKAYEKLGNKLGYQLVGTNLNGCNAFFVRKDLASNKFLEPATAENLYNPFRYNYLQFSNGHPCKRCLKYDNDDLYSQQKENVKTTELVFNNEFVKTTERAEQKSNSEQNESSLKKKTKIIMKNLIKKLGFVSC